MKKRSAEVGDSSGPKLGTEALPRGFLHFFFHSQDPSFHTLQDL